MSEFFFQFQFFKIGPSESDIFCYQFDTFFLIISLTVFCKSLLFLSFLFELISRFISTHLCFNLKKRMKKQELCFESISWSGPGVGEFSSGKKKKEKREIVII